MGHRTFGGYLPFVDWMLSENPTLGGQKPLDLIRTPEGIKRIIDLLRQMDRAWRGARQLT